MEQLIELLGQKLFLFLVDFSTFMNEAGSFYPGNRAIAKRCDTSKNTAQRRIGELVDKFRLIKRTKRGGRRTDHYQVLDPALIKFLIAAWDVYHPNWRDHRRKQNKRVAQAFLELHEPPESGPKGNPYSPNTEPFISEPSEPKAAREETKDKPRESDADKPQHPDPTSSVESPANAQASDGYRCDGADGSAAPRLTAAEVIENAVASLDLQRRFGVHNPDANHLAKRTTLDQTQCPDGLGHCQTPNVPDKALRPQTRFRHSAGPREQVHLAVPGGQTRFQIPARPHDGGFRPRRSDQPPGNSGTRRNSGSIGNPPASAKTPLELARHSWAAENLGLFIDEYGTWEDRKAYWRGDKETIYRFARWKASIDWKPPPEVRARHKFHKRGSEKDRKRALNLLFNGVSNCLPSTISQHTYWNVIVAGKLVGDPSAQIAFDQLVGIYRAKQNADQWSGDPNDRPKRWPGGGKNRGNFDGEGRKVRERWASDTVAPASRARISVGKSGGIFHKYPYATHFEVLGKSFSGGERLGKEANVRSFNDEALTRSANTYAEDRSATRQYADGGTQTRVRNQRAASDRGCPGGPAQSWEEPRLRQRSALAEPPEDQALSWGHVVGSDGAAHPAAAGPGGLTQEGLPPAGGALAGGTHLPRTYDFLQKRPPKNKFRQIEGLPPSTWLVP